MNNVSMDKGERKESEKELEKEYKSGIQETMHSQPRYKGDNLYLSFHERLCSLTKTKSTAL